MKNILCLEKCFQIVEGNEKCFFDYAVLNTKMNKFKDLRMLNLTKILNRSYTSGDSTYEAVLESNHVECKLDYLNLIQYIDNTIDKELNEYIRNGKEIKSNDQLKSFLNKFYEPKIFERIYNKIKLNKEVIENDVHKRDLIR